MASLKKEFCVENAIRHKTKSFPIKSAENRKIKLINQVYEKVFGYVCSSRYVPSNIVKAFPEMSPV